MFACMRGQTKKHTVIVQISFNINKGKNRDHKKRDTSNQALCCASCLLSGSVSLHWTSFDATRLIIVRETGHLCTLKLSPSSLALSDTGTQPSGSKPLTYCFSMRGNGCGQCLSFSVPCSTHTKQTCKLTYHLKSKRTETAYKGCNSPQRPPASETELYCFN